MPTNLHHELASRIAAIRRLCAGVRDGRLGGVSAFAALRHIDEHAARAEELLGSGDRDAA